MVGRTDEELFITTGTFMAQAKKEDTRDGGLIELVRHNGPCDGLAAASS